MGSYMHSSNSQRQRFPPWPQAAAQPFAAQNLYGSMDSRLQNPSSQHHSSIPHQYDHHQQLSPQHPQHTPNQLHPLHYGGILNFAPSMAQPSVPPHQQQAAQAPQSQATRPQTPPPSIGNSDNLDYQLEVVQAPVRARMCGFGDKDRRPITPPPCIRLIIRNRDGQEVNYEDIDQTWFVVTVDLWSQDAQNEINLVRHSATSPSISATSAASYPPQPSQQIHYAGNTPMTQVHMNMLGTQPTQSYYVQEPYSQPHPQYSADPTRSYYSNAGNPSMYGYASAGPNQPQGPMMGGGHMMAFQDPRSAPTGMFTRNLIGSLCVSAFKLEDPDRKPGIWFILQDLSVRTEGSFRLKFSFVNVGNKSQPGQLNTASAPVLATCYSKVFQVYSAKKFPGVIESTKLSKCFAQQGIKIPIRKDGANGSRDDQEED